MKGSIIFISILLLSGCHRERESHESDTPLLFTSILPQAGLVKAVAGDLVKIRTLVGEGQSPHTYEPTARQLAALGEADALLTIGIPFEKKLLKKIAPLYPELEIVRTDTGIERLTMPCNRHAGEGCSHGSEEMDPHVWLSPQNIRIIARNICRALQEIDPDHATTYARNNENLLREMDDLDLTIRKKLAPYAGNRFYVFHPSFGYFAKTYGLEQIPVEMDGKSPSPRQLAALVEDARNDGVKVVFAQHQFPEESAKAVADAIGGTVVRLDPLAEDCVANLRRIAEAMAQALEK